MAALNRLSSYLPATQKAMLLLLQGVSRHLFFFNHHFSQPVLVRSYSDWAQIKEEALQFMLKTENVKISLFFKELLPFEDRD